MKLSELPAPFIICDVGSNWKVTNNDTDNLIMAKRHIHDAKLCGVNAVKFQLFTNQELYGIPHNIEHPYALPRKWIPELAAYCSQVGVEFMCSAFSKEGYDFIDPFVNVHKVASCEMKCRDMYEHLEKPILVSTGGAHHNETEAIMADKDVGFLECVATYPADASDYNLKTLEMFPYYMGISDHTLSDVVALTAVGLGATVFEKHFSVFEKSWAQDIRTPDYPVSIGPSALASYTSRIRTAFSCLGDGRKVPRASERDITARHRRRLKVVKDIAKGESLLYGVNYGAYRSIADDLEAGGPEHYPLFNGKPALRDLKPGDPVWKTTVNVDA